MVVVAFRSDSVTEFQVDCNMERTAGSDQDGNVGVEAKEVLVVAFQCKCLTKNRAKTLKAHAPCPLVCIYFFTLEDFSLARRHE